jgi:hypothetical protein
VSWYLYFPIAHPAYSRWYQKVSIMINLLANKIWFVSKCNFERLWRYSSWCLGAHRIFTLPSPIQTISRSLAMLISDLRGSGSSSRPFAVRLCTSLGEGGELAEWLICGDFLPHWKRTSLAVELDNSPQVLWYSRNFPFWQVKDLPSNILLSDYLSVERPWLAVLIHYLLRCWRRPIRKPS